MRDTAIRIGLPLGAAIVAMLCGLPSPSKAQSSVPSGRICEAKPAPKCLDESTIEGTTLLVPTEVAAIQRDGFQICDSSSHYTNAPDIVLIMDNTGSMDSVQTVAGIPRWCEFPDKETSDPGCISGDPHRLRGPALQAFLDTALVKGGKGMKVGVVTFSEMAQSKSETLLPLTAATKGGIKSSIVMEQDGQTNYTAAFRAAMELLKSSVKPRQGQVIIFISDGRPNYPHLPDGDPYTYKTFWDSLPTVYSLFLGSNAGNYKDMQDISEKTGGLFFHIDDASLLAKLLTDDLNKRIFPQAMPTLTVIQNLSDSLAFRLEGFQHRKTLDVNGYALSMSGPLELAKGPNDIFIHTEYGFGAGIQDLHFKIDRALTGPYAIGLSEACRDVAKLIVFNAKDQAVNLLGLPFTGADSAVRYALTTAADLDSFDIVIKTQGMAAVAQADIETVWNSEGNRKDSTWTGSKPFQWHAPQKIPGDNRLQAEDGETILLTYRNPFIREDSAQVRVKITYGLDPGNAIHGDGKVSANLALWNIGGQTFRLGPELRTGKHRVEAWGTDAVGKRLLLLNAWVDAEDFRHPWSLKSSPIDSRTSSSFVFTRIQVRVDGHPLSLFPQGPI